MFVRSLTNTSGPILRVLLYQEVIVGVARVSNSSYYQPVGVHVFQVVSVDLQSLAASIGRPMVLYSIEEDARGRSLFLGLCLRLSRGVSFQSRLDDIPTAGIANVRLGSVIVLHCQGCGLHPHLFGWNHPFLQVGLLDLGLEGGVLMTRFVRDSMFLCVVRILLETFRVRVSKVPFISRDQGAMGAPISGGSRFVSYVPLQHEVLAREVPNVHMQSLYSRLVSREGMFFFFRLFILFASFVCVM